MAEKPNILLIVIDTVRADHLSTYGYFRPTSPVIDALGKGGTVFEAASSAAPYTRASTASILTGTFPSVHGAVTHADSISEKTTTLAERLQEAGYETAAFHRNGNIAESFGFGRGFSSYVVPDRAYLRQLKKSGEKIQFIHEIDDSILSAAATSFLQDLSPASSSPFFLYLHLQGAHAPYTPPPELLFVDGDLDPAVAEFYKSPLWPEKKEQKEPTVLRKLRNSVVDPRARKQVIALYDGEIAFSDRQVGVILNALKATPFYDNTLIIVTSDHGEELWDHESIGHGRSNFQEVLHVPLVVSGPGVLKQRIQEPVSLVDLTPTLLEAAGLEVLQALPGRSLLGILSQPNPPPAPTPIFSEGLVRMAGDDPLFYRSLQRGKMKLILDFRYERKMLFDLARDPGEAVNVIATEPRTARLLFEELIAVHQANLSSALGDAASAVDIPAELELQLRALGYLGTSDDSEASESIFWQPLQELDLKESGFVGNETDMAGYRSEINFRKPDFPDEQLLYGWKKNRKGKSRKFFSRAGVRLAKTPEQKHWRWKGVLRPPADGPKTIKFSIRIDNGEPLYRTVQAGKWFRWKGSLPAGAKSFVRFDMACESGDDAKPKIQMNDSVSCGKTTLLKLE